MFCRGNILWRKIFVNVSKNSDPDFGLRKLQYAQWLITNLNVILYLSTCHNVYISILILFMIMPQLIINTYVTLMHELKKNGKLFTSKFVGAGPSSYEKRIYRAAVSRRLRNTGLDPRFFIYFSSRNPKKMPQNIPRNTYLSAICQI